jgi:hypothetical protein
LSGRDRRQLLIVALVTVPVGAAIVIGQGLVALVVPTIAGVLGLLLLCDRLADPQGDRREAHRVLRWTMAAFAAHLFFGVLVMSSIRLVYYLGGDATTYHSYASWLVEFGQGSLAKGLQIGKEGYYYTLVGLYKVLGVHALAGIALNATLGAALVPLLTDATRRRFGTAAARAAAPLVVLFPSIFIFTSQLLKEAPILFLLAVALNAAVRVSDRVSPLRLLTLTLSLALLLTFRGPIAAVAGISFIAGIALSKREVVSGLTTALSAVAVAAAVVVGIGVGQSGIQVTLESSSLQDATRVRAGLAQGTDSGFGSDVETSTARQALSYLPIGLSRFAIGPFPWEIRGPRQLPALADVLAIWWLLPKAWRGLRAGISRQGRRLTVFLLPAGAMATVLSLSVGNLGVLVRERMQVFILLVPILALGLSLRSVRAAPADTARREPTLVA